MRTKANKDGGIDGTISDRPDPGVYKYICGRHDPGVMT